MAKKRTAWRALDANLNRAAEGIRVVEDIVRFEYDLGPLAAEFRELRHGLREAAQLLPGGEAALVSARDSRGDVARNAPHLDEDRPRDVLTANLKRAQEAARVLEELSKPLGGRVSSRFGEIRFRIYDLEKNLAEALLRGNTPKPIPMAPFLYAVAGFENFYSGGTFRLFKELISAGAGMIQLRDKHYEDKQQLERASRLARLTQHSRTLFTVNDRVDIALAADADAIHLGQEDISVEDARAIAGDRLRIGFSTHSYSQAMKGLEMRPDYISVGPVFASKTKPENKPVGTGLIEKVASRANGIPIVAIGGITHRNLSDVFNAGASGAAVISAITESKNLKKTLSEINKIINTFKKK